MKLDRIHCTLCPRRCGVDRSKQAGVCGAGNGVRIARAALHHWEEPCISAVRGSGTVFFSGCQLRCCFCQNHEISWDNFGKEISAARLSEIFLELQDQGAHNINLVSPTPYLLWIKTGLEQVKERLTIPVVFNSGGYESVESLRMMEGLVDIYLPDLKFYSQTLSKQYASAADYFEVAKEALVEMYRQVGPIQMGEGGILKRGMILRHLVLPGAREDSVKILEWITGHFEKDAVLLSLMSQYTPYVRNETYPELNRRVTRFEYETVLKKAQELGLHGYCQEKSSAKEEYTPPFDLEGV